MTLDLTNIADAPPAGRGTAARTVGEMMLTAAGRHAGPALSGPGGTTDYRELDRAVREIAAGLAGLGIEVGDRVGILAGTRPEWTLADLGALAAGAVVVPVYHTNSPEECAYVLGHAGVRAVFCEDAAQVAKLAGVRDGLPALEHVIVMDGDAEGAAAPRRAAPERPRRVSGPLRGATRRVSRRRIRPRSSTRRARPDRRRAA